MALTQLHQDSPVLSPNDVEEALNSQTFLSIFDRSTFERAELIEKLTDEGAKVKMRSTGPEDISFQIDKARGEPDSYVIPGKGKPAKAFPVKAAVYVAANRDYPQFGGASWKSEKGSDGYINVVPVPAKPGLIEFELVRE